MILYTIKKNTEELFTVLCTKNGSARPIGVFTERDALFSILDHIQCDDRILTVSDEYYDRKIHQCPLSESSKWVTAVLYKSGPPADLKYAVYDRPDGRKEIYKKEEGVVSLIYRGLDWDSELTILSDMEGSGYIVREKGEDE